MGETEIHNTNRERWEAAAPRWAKNADPVGSGGDARQSLSLCFAKLNAITSAT